MDLKGLNIGLAITGSFCNFSNVKGMIESLKKEGANVIPIVSKMAEKTTTRFFKHDKFVAMLKEESGNNVINSIVLAEPIGPKKMLDILVICPCTGNTMAKLNLGVTDSPVLMAAKSHLRRNMPIVIGISSNDAMGANFKNLADLLNTKNIFFIPFRQDDYINKPKSLVLEYSLLIDTIKLALENIQIQPLMLSS